MMEASGDPIRGAGLGLAIEKAGVVGALARGLGSSQPSVSAWPIDIIDLARAEEYALLAALLIRAPSGELLDRLATLAGDRGDDSPLGGAHANLGAAARTARPEDVAREHFDLFVGVGRGEVLPFASYYRTGFLNERPLARVRADLGRLGLARAEGVFEPEDGLATLLEVMAELTAGRAGQPGDAGSFFAAHLAPWAAQAFGDIATAPAARLYRAVAELGRTWIEIERQAFSLPE